VSVRIGSVLRTASKAAHRIARGRFGRMVCIGATIEGASGRDLLQDPLPAVGFRGIYYGWRAEWRQLLQGGIIGNPVKVLLIGLSGKALKRWTGLRGRSIFQACRR
ncbi:MAG: hypothetical protein WCP62_06670, partial [Planctomycetota bacterium]